MDVLAALEQKGISIRVASPKLVMEEAPESYKNVTDVVDSCMYHKCMVKKKVIIIIFLKLLSASPFCVPGHQAGISEKCFKLRPIAVIKG